MSTVNRQLSRIGCGGNEDIADGYKVGFRSEIGSAVNNVTDTCMASYTNNQVAGAAVITFVGGSEALAKSVYYLRQAKAQGYSEDPYLDMMTRKGWVN